MTSPGRADRSCGARIGTATAKLSVGAAPTVTRCGPQSQRHRARFIAVEASGATTTTVAPGAHHSVLLALSCMLVL